jgi:hypothetical protein
VTEIKWRASSSVSALYVAAALAHGEQLSDARLAEALAPLAETLEAALSAAGFSDDVFWRYAVPLAGATENAPELARQVFRQATSHDPAEQTVIGIAKAMQGLREAFDRARPDAVRELSLRTGPLRELWEARGPGLLAAIGRGTARELIVDQATVYAVPPISSHGGGEAYAAARAVAIEAVLANPHAALPEVARLGWLLARLGSEANGRGLGIAPAKLPRLASLAMIAPTLAAAEFVELAAFDLSTMSLALHAWQGVKPEVADDLAVILDRWWRTYSENRVPWAEAIATLERMVGASTLPRDH